MAHPLLVTANTWALWHFDEAAGSTLADSGPRGINLLLDPNGGVDEAIVSSRLTRARRFSALGCYSQSSPAGMVPGSAADLAMWQGEWTVEILYTPTASAPVGLMGMFAYGTRYATPANHHEQFTLYVNRGGANNNTLVVTWTGATGQTTVFSTAAFTDTTTFIAVVKRIVAGVASLDFYINGVLQQTVAGLALPDGGTGAGWVIGASDPSDGVAAPATPSLRGDLDELRVSNVAFTGAQVLTDWQAVSSVAPVGFGAGGGSGGGGSGTRLQAGATSILDNSAGILSFKTETDHAYDVVGFGLSRLNAANNGGRIPLVGAGNAFLLRTLVPNKKRRARRLSLQYQHAAAFEYIAISGVSFLWNEYTDGEKTGDQ